MKKTVSLILVIALLVNVLMSLCGCMFTGSKAALDQFMTALNDPSEKNIRKLAPKEYWDYIADENNYDDDDLYLKEICLARTGEFLGGLKDYFGIDLSISYTINKREEATSFRLDNIKQQMEKRYEISKKKVKSVVSVELTYHITGSYNKEEGKMTVYAVQIGSKWYLCDRDGSFLTVLDMLDLM